MGTNAMTNIGCAAVLVMLGTRCGGVWPEPECPTVLLYRDDDGDGFGARGAGVIQACEGEQVPGYVANGADCADAEPRVFPGQKMWQTSPRTDGALSASAWDFNCDGFATPRWTARGVCRQTEVYCEIYTAPVVVGGYWSVNAIDGMAPQCGVEGTWIHWCRASGAICAIDSEMRTQACL